MNSSKKTMNINHERGIKISDGNRLTNNKVMLDQAEV